jgi:hypothetical protein
MVCILMWCEPVRWRWQGQIEWYLNSDEMDGVVSHRHDIGLQYLHFAFLQRIQHTQHMPWPSTAHHLHHCLLPQLLHVHLCQPPSFHLPRLLHHQHRSTRNPISKDRQMKQHNIPSSMIKKLLKDGFHNEEVAH